MAGKKTFIQKLIDRQNEYDIRKMYVGIPVRQSSIKTQLGIWEDYCSWEFESINGEKPKFDLFMKTLTGYKSILSDVNYKASSIHTPNKIVLAKKSIHPLGQFDPDIIVIVKENYGSYRVNKDVVKMIKQTINGQLHTTKSATTRDI